MGVIRIFFFYSYIISKFSLRNMHYLYNQKKKQVCFGLLDFFFLMTSLDDGKYVSQKKVEGHPALFLLMAL